jgi:hypothetical protein
MNTPETSSKQSESRGNGGERGSNPFGSQGMAAPSKPEDRTEGTLATMIESQTSKLPSDTFLWAAVGAMGVSAVLQLTGAKDKSRFFGQWVAPMLLFGVYNKLVKQQGHDQLH